MNKNSFGKTDYVIVIFVVIFLSFGITIPFGILLFIYLFLRKINFSIEKKNEVFNTSFYN